jgi:hypothetical protein
MLVNGKVFYDVRAQDSAAEWLPGHAMEDPPSIETFAAECLRLITKPVRVARHDAV